MVIKERDDFKLLAVVFSCLNKKFSGCSHSIIFNTYAAQRWVCKMLYNPQNPTFATAPFAFVSYLIVFIFSFSE
jgi:hypothetical protein